MLSRPAKSRDLPSGPPLHLDVPGRALEVLGPFVLPERIARMNLALDARTTYVAPVLEHLHDPHNIGACVRTMDALGLHEFHVIKQPPGPVIDDGRQNRMRLGRDITRGSEKWLDMHIYDDPATAYKALKARGFRIAVTDIHGDRPAYTPLTVPLDQPLAVVFGNEHEGVTQLARDAADMRLMLPMHGFVESLNVSVATALIMGRLRERVDCEIAAEQRALTAELRTATLDAWICGEVQNLRVVLRALATRAATPPD